MTIEQTVTMSSRKRLETVLNVESKDSVDIPREAPAGAVTLRFTPAHSARGFDPRLRDAVDPAMYGKGEITGDIIGPFYDVWEQGN